MGKTNYTQISGFYLYVSAARYRKGATALAFKDYAPVADLQYQKLTEEEKDRWKNRARELRLEDVGKAFRLTDKLLKTTELHDPKLFDARETCVKHLVMRCWDLSL